MDHQSAVERGLIDRYVLGELDESEAAALEEHAFECVACAEDLRHTDRFLANLRAVWREERLRPERPARAAGRWGGIPLWLPAAAAIMLAVVTVYQNTLVLPELRRSVQPQAVVSVTLRAVTRGVDQAVDVGPNDRFIHLAADVNAPGSYSSVQCELLPKDGPPVAALAAPVTHGTIHLQLPAGRYPPGPYTLVLRDPQDRRELDRFPFVIRREEAPSHGS